MQTVHLFGRMNQDDADKDLTADQIRYAKNLVTERRGNGLRRTKARSNVSIENRILQSYAKSQLGNVSQSEIDTFYNTIKCIGTYENTANQDVFLFYKNPDLIVKFSVNEGISSNSYSVVADGTLINFYDTKRIFDISIVDSFLFWNIKGKGQFYIDLSGNIDYSGLTVDDIKLQKLAPITAPKVSEYYNENGVLTPSEADRKYTKDKAIKFAYRFVYKDNTVSTFSPLSKPVLPSKADPIYFNSEADYKAQLPVYYSLQSDNIYDIKSIKSIDLAVVGTNGLYSLFKSINTSFSIGNFFSTNGLLGITYLGNETLISVSQEESLKIQEPNPVSPDTSVAFNDRVFQCGGFTGRNNSDFNEVKVTPSSQVIRSGYQRTPLFKPKGQYQYGVQFFDEDHKRSFVQNKKIYEFPEDSFEVNQDRYLLKLSTSGQIPSWAKYFQFCVSPIQNIDAYVQCPAFVLFNILDQVGEIGVLENEYVWKDGVYLDKSQDVSASEYSYAHLVLPQNIPFEITPGYKVKLRTIDKSSNNSVIIRDVIEVRGNMLIVEPFDSYGALGPVRNEIEIYKENIQYDELIYETGETYPINRWGETFDIFGDTYLFDGSNLKNIEWQFEKIVAEDGNINDLITKDYISDLNGSGTFNFNETNLKIVTISQTNTTLKNTEVSTIEQVEDVTLIQGRKAAFRLFGLPVYLNGDPKFKIQLLSRITQTKSSLTLDYNKAIDSTGRVNVKNESDTRLELRNTIYFSDNKIQDSKVNGLANFNFRNSYVLPSERGPVTQLVPVNDSVLLCLHPRNTTTLYIGEGFIRQGDDAILAKTEGVVGDDRLLQGNYGTLNPGSVVNYKGTVFFWDKNERDLVRYNNNGLTPLGKVYKMKSFFEKWGQLLKDSNLEVIGGFDVFYGMYVVTFPAIGNQASETIAFKEITNSENKGFITFLDYQGQAYTSFGEDFVSINKNKTWVHDNSTSKLYGNNFDVDIEFVHNENPMATKIYENIAINSDKPWITEVESNRGQLTDMIEKDYRLYEDTFYTEVLRDKNTPDDLMKAGQIKLRDGNLIKGQSANIKLSSNEATQLNEVVVGTQLAGGQYLMG